MEYGNKNQAYGRLSMPSCLESAMQCVSVSFISEKIRYYWLDERMSESANHWTQAYSYFGWRVVVRETSHKHICFEKYDYTIVGASCQSILAD